MQSPKGADVEGQAGRHTVITFDQAASESDLATVRGLFEEYATWLGFSLSFQDFAEELATLPGKYTPPSGRLLLARHDGGVAGCGALRPLEPGICEMKRLFVRPACRGQGIGRGLVERLVAEATAIGYSLMRLDTAPGKMAGANHIYDSRGFREIPAYYHNPYPGVRFLELRLD